MPKEKPVWIDIPAQPGRPRGSYCVEDGLLTVVREDGKKKTSGARAEGNNDITARIMLSETNDWQ